MRKRPTITMITENCLQSFFYLKGTYNTENKKDISFEQELSNQIPPSKPKRVKPISYDHSLLSVVHYQGFLFAA